MTPWAAISGIPRSFNSLKGNLRSFIRPDHILLRIDAEFDFAGLVAPLKRSIALTMGALPLHPEAMVLALLLSAIYNIPSFRQLCLSISENIAFRWFLFMSIGDEVFDHSTTSYFIDFIKREDRRGRLQSPLSSL